LLGLNALWAAASWAAALAVVLARMPPPRPARG
ncbi:DUF1275 domain-containing protein, partial [Rhodococcus hoagii]|nr:DUF1275 domain-containing protein [Prescottella equi]